jgi:hypothetical protein
VISHRPIIGASHSPGNQETATAGQTLRLPDLIQATFAPAGLTLTVSYKQRPRPARRACGARRRDCTGPQASMAPRQVGAGKTLDWPAGEGADGNSGVATTVYSTPWSIGYIEQAYSMGLLLPFAAIRNQAGTYVTPSAQTIAADAAQKPQITPTDFSIVNEPGAGSYPISGYSWALIYTRQASQATGQALVAMLDWLTHAGQAYAAANDYVPLPAPCSSRSPAPPAPTC